MVAAGTGVSLGAGVTLGWLICATAVSNAAVITIFASGCAGAEEQDDKKRASRVKVRARLVIGNWQLVVRGSWFVFMGEFYLKKNETPARANVSP